MASLILHSYDDKALRYLKLRIRRLQFDQALSAGMFRLEYRYPEAGFRHYLLVRGAEPVAIQYIRADDWFEETFEGLAFVLSFLGFTYRNTQKTYARTPLRFEHNRLSSLFTVSFQTKHQTAEEVDALFEVG